MSTDAVTCISATVLSWTLTVGSLVWAAMLQWTSALRSKTARLAAGTECVCALVTRLQISLMLQVTLQSMSASTCNTKVTSGPVKLNCFCRQLLLAAPQLWNFCVHQPVERIPEGGGEGKSEVIVYNQFAWVYHCNYNIYTQLQFHVQCSMTCQSMSHLLGTNQCEKFLQLSSTGMCCMVCVPHLLTCCWQIWLCNWSLAVQQSDNRLIKVFVANSVPEPIIHCPSTAQYWTHELTALWVGH